MNSLQCEKDDQFLPYRLQKIFTILSIDPLSREHSYVLSARIPSVPDPDVLHTYLANRDTGAIPKILSRSRPFGLHAKLGTKRRFYDSSHIPLSLALLNFSIIRIFFRFFSLCIKYL